MKTPEKTNNPTKMVISSDPRKWKLKVDGPKHFEIEIIFHTCFFSVLGCIYTDIHSGENHETASGEMGK